MTELDDMHISLPPPAFPQGPPSHPIQQQDTIPTPLPYAGSPNSLSTPPRISFSDARQPRGYGFLRYQSLLTDDDSEPPERPPIPSALPTAHIDSTPLPKIPMIVLSIAVLGEFLSANVSTPFIVDMVKGFDLGDEAELGSYTGMIVAAFFVTQFLTSILWATVAGKHGNRAVLFVALLGNAITCSLFGTCTSFSQAVAVRLIQGVFNGAVGVARGSVTNVTDPTNESRAYAIMGFSWGLGGVGKRQGSATHYALVADSHWILAGAIIGGVFESPVKRWPTTFGRLWIFQKYPYLLPTMIASAVLLTGAVLSLFLAWDGGPSEGAIFLGIEKRDEEQATAPVATTINLAEPHPREEHVPSAAPGPVNLLRQSVHKKLSGYFASRVREAHDAGLDTVTSPGPTHPVHIPKGRTFSRTSRATGSAYGYRRRQGSQTTLASGQRRGSLRSTGRPRRDDNHPQEGEVGVSQTPREDLNFAQRLVMANELTGTSLTNLWVAAAINVEHEHPFAGTDDELSSDEEEEEDGFGTSPNQRSSLRRYRSMSSRRTSTPLNRHLAHHHSSNFVPFNRQLSLQSTGDASVAAARRYSMTSYPFPAIYANPGVTTPSALLEAQAPPAQSGPQMDPFSETLMPIIEGSPIPAIPEGDQTGPVGKADGLKWTLLPLFIILQYFILALHSTSHDQVFLMYLTSAYTQGGLGLEPGHFAFLIALMCIAQVVYQFYLYPNIGPPRGKFSHLAMFRIGTALFIPGYVTVVFYRRFASSTDDGTPLLMSLLAISTAVRYAGATFAYTSVAILLNYMSPPELVSFSNGLAQSLASLARVLGPVLGGALWSESTMNDPNGYALGFYACAVLCSVAIFLSFFIR
ncbi:hypothetical protein BS47DRAFT_1329332 [Hydnum rufescens UP504]|uniref:Uncharacterized protein n=1 Tax=Hydnum rufescens UP504 TaxID=1448309 RepID=A0A9P6AYP6_9AGAM|nr:hypothetical protein BS47DRAFT_1329332 [Hydnum rufescens UP504]